MYTNLVRSNTSNDILIEDEIVDELVLDDSLKPNIDDLAYVNNSPQKEFDNMDLHAPVVVEKTDVEKNFRNV